MTAAEHLARLQAIASGLELRRPASPWLSIFSGGLFVAVTFTHPWSLWFDAPAGLVVVACSLRLAWGYRKDRARFRQVQGAALAAVDAIRDENERRERAAPTGRPAVAEGAADSTVFDFRSLSKLKAGNAPSEMPHSSVFPASDASEPAPRFETRPPPTTGEGELSGALSQTIPGLSEAFEIKRSPLDGARLPPPSASGVQSSSNLGRDPVAASPATERRRTVTLQTCPRCGHAWDGVQGPVRTLTEMGEYCGTCMQPLRAVAGDFPSLSKPSDRPTPAERVFETASRRIAAARSRFEGLHSSRERQILSAIAGDAKPQPGPASPDSCIVGVAAGHAIVSTFDLRPEHAGTSFQHCSACGQVRDEHAWLCDTCHEPIDRAGASVHVCTKARGTPQAPMLACRGLLGIRTLAIAKTPSDPDREFAQWIATELEAAGGAVAPCTLCGHGPGEHVWGRGCTHAGCLCPVRARAKPDAASASEPPPVAPRTRLEEARQRQRDTRERIARMADESRAIFDASKAKEPPPLGPSDYAPANANAPAPGHCLGENGVCSGRGACNCGCTKCLHTEATEPPPSHCMRRHFGCRGGNADKGCSCLCAECVAARTHEPLVRWRATPADDGAPRPDVPPPHARRKGVSTWTPEPEPDPWGLTMAQVLRGPSHEYLLDASCVGCRATLGFAEAARGPFDGVKRAALTEFWDKHKHCLPDRPGDGGNDRGRVAIFVARWVDLAGHVWSADDTAAALGKRTPKDSA